MADHPDRDLHPVKEGSSLDTCPCSIGLQILVATKARTGRGLPRSALIYPYPPLAASHPVPPDLRVIQHLEAPPPHVALR
jgi:hypothetical protein